nr:FecR domain-containing protein [Betaproteobacteria bacterium]
MNPRTILHRTFAACIAVVGLIAAGWASADPPSRVARLSYTQGVVSFSPAGDDDWVQARLNRPLVRGDRLWTDNDARAELQIGVGAVRLAEYTSVSLLDISNRITQFQLAQGTLSVRVRHLRRGEAVEIATPNLAFAIERPGEYRIAVDPRGEATTIVVRSGQGQVFGDGVAYELRDQEAVRFYGSNLADPEFLAFDAPDPFERWAGGREQRVDRAIAARYVAPEVIGYEDLDAHGSWRSVEGYGTVWTPRAVAADWAPYSTGHWSWIEPYGWTWVDDAPWGFAPYHYGRWAHIRGSWSWVPGPRSVQPVYAPALVAFVGGSNFRVSISSGPATSGIAWFPLAPGEVYRPAYNVTPDYFRNVNVSNTVVSNTYITNVYNQTNVTEVNYRNREVSNAITAVPAVAFAQSQPVQKVAVPVNREAISRAQVMTSLAAVAPTPMSMTGGAPPAAQKPAVDVLRRTAVVRQAPPPPVAPLAPAPQRLEAQQQVPGRAPERAPVAVRPATPAPAPNVKVVGTETPKPMPMRSRERDEGRSSTAPG